MFVLAVTIDVDADHVEDFREAIRTQAANSRAKEPWCVQFDVCTDPDLPTRFFLYEKYDERASIEKHRSTEHFAIYNETVTPWVVAKSVSMWAVDG